MNSALRPLCFALLTASCAAAPTPPPAAPPPAAPLPVPQPATSACDGTYTVDLLPGTPRDATVTLHHGDEVKAVPMLPIRIAFPLNEDWTLVAKREGFATLTRLIAPPVRGCATTITVTLARTTNSTPTIQAKRSQGPSSASLATDLPFSM